MKSEIRTTGSQKKASYPPLDMTDPFIAQMSAARKAGRLLTRKFPEERRKVLLAMADHIERQTDAILQANRVDLENFASRVLDATNRDVLKKRLVLNKNKVAEIVEGVRSVADMNDPVGGLLMARELDEGLRLYKVACPIGLIGIIFESRPDALPQILSLCLKSANAAVLKGGREAEETNKCIFECIRTALKECQFDPEIFLLTHNREDVEKMLAATGVIDLLVPRGSNSLVQHIMDSTHIPVLGHAAGICHIYVDSEADLSMAAKICDEAKASYPAACNAVETILVHQDVAARFLPSLLRVFNEEGVEARCDRRALSAIGNDSSGAKPATDDDFGREFSDLIVAIKVVDNLDQAIDHINQFSSRHTDAIITGNAVNAQRFFDEVDSAGVYHNVSTRFADGFRYGFGAEVGIATGKLHPRGPVGVDGLMTYKYKIEGHGHVASDYSGEDARQFTHVEIDLEKLR